MDFLFGFIFLSAGTILGAFLTRMFRCFYKYEILEKVHLIKPTSGDITGYIYILKCMDCGMMKNHKAENG